MTELVESTVEKCDICEKSPSSIIENCAKIILNNYSTSECKSEKIKELRTLLDGNLELCSLAVGLNGLLLIFVPEEMKTPELCALAMKRTCLALGSVPENFMTYEMCLNAMRHDGELLMYVPKQFKTMEMCIAALKQTRRANYFIPFGVTICRKCIRNSHCRLCH
ncbi:MAG: hypothetical protein AAB966_00285 [Patescibacteria group bacterium]